jgi:hypothetical protein
VGFVAETKAPMAPGARAGSHLFFRSRQDTYSPDLHALLATAAVGTTAVKPNEGLVARGAVGKPVTFFFTENGTDPGHVGEV